MSERNDLKIFGFAIGFTGYSNNKLQYKVQVIDEGVPKEVIIMQLKSILRNLEKEYYNKEKSI